VTTADREDFFLSGLGLTLALVVITVFAFVLPPVLALQLHHRREARAVAQVQEVAIALGQGAGAHLAADPQLREIGVLNGPGDVVTDALDRTWITARAASLEPYVNLPAEGLTPDPWLRALQVNIGAARAGGRLWVLSAGPNGIIDTPFVSTGNAVPGGDDIAVPLP
jgi:hypothetical protein